MGLIWAQIGGAWPCVFRFRPWVCREEWFSNAHDVLVEQGKMETVWNPPSQGVSRCYKREQFLIGNKHAREYTNFWVFFCVCLLRKFLGL